jgi:Zn-dependent protease with chaperone function
VSTPGTPAFRFDGRQADAAPTRVRVEGAHLVVETPEGALLERPPLDRVAVSEPFGRAPRMLWLPHGVTLEVLDADGAFDLALQNGGVPVPLAVRVQGWWPGVVLALLGIVSLLAVGYFKALPAVAQRVAFALPPQVEDRLGTQILAVLDRHYFTRSALGAQRRADIGSRLADAAARAAPGVAYHLEFRSAGKHGINAMALPGGIIVMLDGLVVFSEDNELLGVLGHELGHVARKHSTRALLQSAGVGALAGLLWGDFSGAAASVPIALGVLRYSRESEREADDFAVTVLRAHGLSARPLCDFFARLQE